MERGLASSFTNTLDILLINRAAAGHANNGKIGIASKDIKDGMRGEEKTLTWNPAAG